MTARAHPLRVILVAFAVAGVAVPQPPDAAAATIRASFTPIRMTARPGEILTTSYQLKLQEGDPAAHFKVVAQDWWRSEDGQQSFYAAAGSIMRSCAPWVSANPRESALGGGETLQVRLTINVPEDVRPGGYWCALTIDEQPDPLAATPEGVGIRFLASVSTGIYVYVNPIERGADILSVDIVGDRAVARIANTGNTPLAVEGRYEFFRPGDSQAVAIVQLPRNILLTEPIATGEYAATLPERSQLPPGRYLVRLVLDIGLDHYIAVQRELDIERVGPR
jgi:hypothetical protein